MARPRGVDVHTVDVEMRVGPVARICEAGAGWRPTNIGNALNARQRVSQQGVTRSLAVCAQYAGVRMWEVQRQGRRYMRWQGRTGEGPGTQPWGWRGCGSFGYTEVAMVSPGGHTRQTCPS